ncbi:MAG: sigma-70 family RNA polymerase sigma factor [Ktedonobacteraceae bacterium]
MSNTLDKRAPGYISGIDDPGTPIQRAIPGIAITNIEQTLAAARPRLVRLAQHCRVAPDALDDVVQESLLDAWRHLETLQQPERFDAWLNGICRNRCLRWSQSQKSQQRYTEEPLLDDEGSALDIPDPWDPNAELDHQDLATLLERALGYLSDDARTLVELCYLVEQPQREVAARLGLTINVVEARLHRARRRLQQVLTTDLRQDALAFGLALADEPDGQWRESREWCWSCGRHRLLGTFEPRSDGLVSLVMRCPTCSVVVDTGGLPRFDGQRAFRPALKRLLQATALLANGLEDGTYLCPMCETPQPVRVLHPDEFAATHPDSLNIGEGRSMLVLDCPHCNIRVESRADGCLWSLPVVQRFKARHPRAVSEAETIVEYAGQLALCVRLTDINSAARLTLLVHHRTLRVLAIFQE